MRVLVCGDRNWTDYSLILERLSKLAEPQYRQNVVVVEGEARGADSLGKRAAQVLGMQLEPYPANWKEYGRAAGPIRNKQMLDSGVDLVLAFHDDLSQSKGTRDMVNRARKAGVNVEVIGHG